MQKIKKIERLPEKFRIYFWDCDFDNLSFEKYQIFIAERILNFGTLDAVRWLYSRISISDIKNILLNGRGLNNKTKNYLQIIYGK